jgi:hypothetical protein
VGLSCLQNGRLDLRDLVYSPVAGGVMVGSSAALVSSSAGAIVLGAVAGALQVLLQRWEGRVKWYFLVENNVLFLFGLQGILGGFFSAVFHRLAVDYHADLYPTSPAEYSLTTSSGQLEATGISMAIAICAGTVVGVLVNFLNREITPDHYHDRAYWLTEQDGLSSAEDINLPSETEVTDTSEGSERPFEVFKEVVIHHEKGFKDKFV